MALKKNLTLKIEKIASKKKKLGLKTKKMGQHVVRNLSAVIHWMSSAVNLLIRFLSFVNAVTSYLSLTSPFGSYSFSTLSFSSGICSSSSIIQDSIRKTLSSVDNITGVRIWFLLSQSWALVCNGNLLLNTRIWLDSVFFSKTRQPYCNCVRLFGWLDFFEASLSRKAAFLVSIARFWLSSMDFLGWRWAGVVS